MWRPRTVAQTSLAIGVIPSFPLVEGLSGDPEMPTSPCHAPRGPCRLLQHLESPRSKSYLLRLCHRVSVSRIFDETKTLLTLPSLWTHRTRPQGNWKLQNSFHSANSVHHQFRKRLQPNRREPQVSTVSWDFTFFSIQIFSFSEKRQLGKGPETADF